VVYRESNIEQYYYYYLGKAERSLFKKAMYFMEFLKLKSYENSTVCLSDIIVTVNYNDESFFSKKCSHTKIMTIPSFHPFKKCESIPGKGHYVLYHGNLSISENHKAAVYLIKKVFSRINNFRFIIAGKNPRKSLEWLCDQFPHIHLIKNPDPWKMDLLIKNAHIHALYTHQNTGLKLKLLFSLFKGRFVIANQKMVDGSRLDDYVMVVNTPEEWRKIIKSTINREFSLKEIEKRSIILQNQYNNYKNAEKLYQTILYESERKKIQ
jgi:glycosyltransferase involved in cell wall biosynthesis